MSPFCGQLSDKSQLAFAFDMVVRGMERNRDGKSNAERFLAVQRTASLSPQEKIKAQRALVFCFRHHTSATRQATVCLAIAHKTVTCRSRRSATGIGGHGLSGNF
jgi:hypothetical protein